MKVTFDNVYNAFQIIAPKGTMISYTATPTAIADGVYVIGDEGSICIDDQLTDTLYLSTVGSDYTVTDGSRVIYPLGDTSVIIRGNISTVPFKSGAKGGGSGGDNTHYKGTTTTPISNGSTTNPITIDGESYTAVFGDIVVYGYTEFVFDGTQWSEFGRPFDTTPTSGSANAVTSDGIYKNTAGKKYYSGNTLKGEIFNSYTKNTASGASSHAEGMSTKANGDYSHAEGNGTTASGYYSHAEGMSTTASGIMAHAEGGGSTASGECSHAEGSYTIASGAYSHTEGAGSTASGECSHASGGYTNASQPNMTAIGKYNSPRTGDLFNVGNGTDDNARSNIFEANSTSVNVNGTIQRNGVGIDDYTTTERKIGKWIDGSDLYQRTFEVTGLSKNTWNNSILDTSDIKIVDFTGLIYWLDNQAASDSTPLNYYASGSDNCFTCINTAQTDMRIYPTNTSSDMSIDKAVITIKYTKPSVQANLMQTTLTEEVLSETPTVEEDDMR